MTMTPQQQFIKQATAIKNRLNDGYTKIGEVRQRIQDLEKKRKALFPNEKTDWPGFDFVRVDGGYRFIVRLPIVDDDYREAWILDQPPATELRTKLSHWIDDYLPLSTDEETELRGILIRTLSAWIDEVKTIELDADPPFAETITPPAGDIDGESAKGIKLWNEDCLTWPAVAVKLGYERESAGAIEKRIRRYADKHGIELRKGKPGSPQQVKKESDESDE